MSAVDLRKGIVWREMAGASVGEAGKGGGERVPVVAPATEVAGPTGAAFAIDKPYTACVSVHVSSRLSHSFDLFTYPSPWQTDSDSVYRPPPVYVLYQCMYIYEAAVHLP